MRDRRFEHGLSWVGFLVLIAAVAGAYWLFTFGPSYLDNAQVKQLAAQAANLCYTNGNDESVRKWLYDHIRQQFEYDVVENGMSRKAYKVDLEPADIHIERTTVPPHVNIDVTYARVVTLPVVGGARTLYFAPHAEQDLSPVKW